MTTETDRRLMQAAYDGNPSAVNAALSDGAQVNARAEFGDTALNEAAEHGHLEVVRRLIEAGADVHNLGGADKTPIMNAAFAGHVEIVRLLLEHGARVSDDLLSSVQLKINILEENAEAGMVLPEAAEAWKGFLDLLITARLRQDLPEIVSELSADDPDVRKNALDRLQTAASRELDVSAALPRLRELSADADTDTRYAAGKVLARHHVQRGEWDGVREALETGDEDARDSAMSVLVPAVRDGAEASPLFPALVALLTSPRLNLRHDAAVALGYAATNELDVSSTIPHLTQLLSDPEPPARKMAAWALYRIAKHLADISPAVPALQARLSDDDEGVAEMAQAALRMSEARGE